MTEAEHTPPPWEVIEGDFAPDGHARYTMGHYWLRATDAQFIAAAPEMFDALVEGQTKVCMACHHRYGYGMKEVVTHSDTCLKMQAVLAKARGETEGLGDKR